jgi:hypothetical protein
LLNQQITLTRLVFAFWVDPCKTMCMITLCLLMSDW